MYNFKQRTSTKFYTIFCCTWSNQQHRLFVHFGKQMTCEVCALFYNFATIYPFVHNQVTFCSTRHMLVKYGCPGSNRVKIWQTSPIPTFSNPPPPGGWGVSEVRGSNRWTYSPSLFTVSSTKFSILHVVSGTELRTDRQTNGRTDRRTEDPITRCSRRTFHYFWVPNTATATIHILLIN